MTLKNHLTLTRFAYDSEATLGRLAYSDSRWCYTLEDAWNENAVGVSCIPEGEYQIRRDTFRGRYPNFALVDVPGRTAIEFHAGNSHLDTAGCILLGMTAVLDQSAQLAWLQHSRSAFDDFMDTMDGVDEAVLLVTSRWRLA